jgi:hypothetical protein
MLRKMPRVNPLQLRKDLLVAESELNRAQLIEEWQAMTAGVRTLGARVKYVGTLASAAGLLVAGVSAFRRGRASPNGAKFSWLETALKGAQVAGSIWLACRGRGRDQKDQ